MRTDPRVARSRASIMQACADLIAEEGIGGVTVEAVSARSGAAKTTIYRHWPSREALLLDAVGACCGPAGPPPDTGSARGDVRAVLAALAARLNDPEWCATMRSLLDAAGREPELRRLHAATMAERRRPLADALTRAADRGELPAGLDVTAGVALLAGPLFYRAMISHEPLDDGFVDAVVDAVLPPAPRRDGAGGG